MQTQTQPASIADASKTLIKIQHLAKRYGTVQALSDFSLEIPRGSIFGLIGPNGSGKTTLLRILAALISPTSGQVSIDGEDVTRSPASIQRKLGYMPDFFGVYPDLTVSEYLEFYAGIHGIARNGQQRIINDLLELVDLSPQRDVFVETLSRGMKQRLCLARALVHDPELLLLDEPASGLDPRVRVELRELLKSLQSLGKTIVISSHILPEIAEICSNLAIIQGGRLIASGDSDELMRTYQLHPGRPLTIRITDAGRVSETLDLLNAMSTIGNATSSEERLIHADFSGKDDELHDVLATLISHMIPVEEFSARRDGNQLEEVFTNATEGSSQS